MSDPIVTHEHVTYQGYETFAVKCIYRENYQDGILSAHWHEELEISLGFQGNSVYWIDGKCIRSQPNRLIVINSESIHNILPDWGESLEKPVAVVLLIQKKFLEENVPDFHSLYFLNEKTEVREEIYHIMMELWQYENGEKEAYQFLWAKGLVLQLISLLCQEGVARRNEVYDINYEKNLYRMKGVIQHIENHYTEHLTMAEVAKKFYFNKDYFSRYFKQNMGVSFTEYVMGFRLEKVRLDLENTSLSVLEIAYKNEFSDNRRLILGFKKKYGITPFQYRKKIRQS